MVIPKSSNRSRIAQNLAVLDWTLDAEHLDVMGDWEEALVTGWNPVDQP